MIWCDQNEQVTSKIPAMLKDLGLPIVIGSPPPNQSRFDYIINNDVAVERKEVADYFQSKQSGHLDSQLYQMSTNFSLSFLVIIGNIQNYMIQNRIPPQTFYGSYIGSQIKVSPDGKQGTVIVNNVPTDEDFVLYLKILHDKFQEGNFTRLPKFTNVKATPDDVALNVLCSFKNIGMIKGKEVLKKYGSLGEALLVLLTSGQWNVKGIGEKIQKEILETLNHKYGELKWKKT